MNKPEKPDHELLLSAVWESSADAMRITDSKGIVIDVNEAYCTLTGFDKKTIIGKSYELIYDKEEQAGSLKYYKKYIESEKTIERAHKIVTLSSGRLLYIDASYSQIIMSGEIYILTIIRDITEFMQAVSDVKNAHEELKESEEKYRAIIESSHDIVLMLDIKGHFTFANKRAEEITGYKISNWLGKSFISIVHPDYLQRVQEGFQNAIQGKADRYEFQIRNSINENLILAANTVPVFENEKVINVVSICRDITNRKQAEEALKESENKYRELVENSPEAIAIYAEGNIVFVNRECISLMEANSEEELIGKPVIQFVHPDYQTLVIERMSKVANEGNVLPLTEERFITLNGSEVDVEVKAVPIKLKNKPAVQLIIRDITERKLTEEALKKNEERYQTLFEISPSGIVLLDENGIILESNDAISNILQYTPKELKGMNVRKLSLPERYEKIDDDIKRIISGEILNNEIENIRKDGTICILELQEKAVTLKNGMRGILATVNDITLRKQSQEAEISLRMQINKILDLVPSYIFAKDYDGKFLMVNKSLADLFGVSTEEVVGKTDLDYGANPEQINGYITADRQVIDSGKEVFIKEEQVLRKDGSLGWFQTHKIPYHHPGIDKPAILGVAVDVTERKKAEEILQESESRYRALVDLAVDGILLGSHEGMIIDANEIMCTLTGMDKGNFIGKHISVLPFTQDSLMSNPFRFDLLQKGEIILNERVIIHTNGTEVVVEMRSKMMPDGTYQSIFRDVTERKKAEEELTKQKHFFEQMFMQSSVSTQILDSEGWCERINPKLSDIFGVEPKNIEGKVYNIFKDEGIKQGGIIPYLERVFNEGKTAEWEVYFDIGIAADSQNIDVKERKKVWYYNWAYPIFDDNGKILNVIIQHNNITERKQGEEEIKLKNEQLEKTNAEKDKFFSIIAHDLRGPFTGFLGLTNLIKSDLHTLSLKELQEIADNINRNANNLFGLLTNLLEWSISQRGLTGFKPETLSLINIVEENINIYDDTVKQKKIEIQMEITEDIKILADRAMFETIIRNLFSNALKFTKKGGSVTISAKNSDSYVEVSIKDSGIGMSNNLVNDLFKIDKKTSRKGTDDEPSTGLGLLLCKEYVEKHNGKILVVSKENKGSEFMVCLPRV